jgi:hypothetical protein
MGGELQRILSHGERLFRHVQRRIKLAKRECFSSMIYRKIPVARGKNSRLAY